MQRKFIEKVKHFFSKQYIFEFFIYHLADTQKQERIEQMVADINKYKKIDRDLSALQTKHTELEKDLTFKLDNITHQRDDLQKSSEQLKEKLQQYEQLQIKYDEFIQNQTKSSNIDELQQELNELKAKNDVLRQRNWKIMEQLNKLSYQQKQNQSS
jgi:chromosome segregation ATPase